MAARLFRHAAPATVLLARFAVSLVLIGCAKPVATGTLTAAAAHPPASAPETAWRRAAGRWAAQTRPGGPQRRPSQAAGMTDHWA